MPIRAICFVALLALPGCEQIETLMGQGAPQTDPPPPPVPETAAVEEPVEAEVEPEVEAEKFTDIDPADAARILAIIESEVKLPVGDVLEAEARAADLLKHLYENAPKHELSAAEIAAAEEALDEYMRTGGATADPSEPEVEVLPPTKKISTKLTMRASAAKLARKRWVEEARKKLAASARSQGYTDVRDVNVSEKRCNNKECWVTARATAIRPK